MIDGARSQACIQHLGLVPTRRWGAWLLLVALVSPAHSAIRSGRYESSTGAEPLFVDARPREVLALVAPGRFVAIGHRTESDFRGVLRSQLGTNSHAVPCTAVMVDSITLTTRVVGAGAGHADGEIRWIWRDTRMAPEDRADSRCRATTAYDTAKDEWRCRTRPNDILLLTHGRDGESTMLVPGRYITVGFFEDTTFTGVLRSLAVHSASARPTLRVMSASLGPGPLLRMGEGETGPSSPAEEWDFTSEDARAYAERWIEPAPSPATTCAPWPDPSADSIPKFGDYVYVEELPASITRVPPIYPEKAKKAGIQGTVMVYALVGRDGRVHDIRVVKSIPELDEAAMNSVRQWVFDPARSAGKPVVVWVGVPVQFKTP